MRKSIRQKLANSKRRIQRRLDKTNLRGCSKPIMTASNIHYEIAQRTRGLSVGGIGAIHALAHRLGLPQAIDQRLHLLQLHLPYHESDHVLTLAYLPLCGGPTMFLTLADRAGGSCAFAVALAVSCYGRHEVLSKRAAGWLGR